VENVLLKNIMIEYKGQITSEPWQQISPPDSMLENAPRSMKIRPSWGFYIRHAKDVKLENVHIFLEKQDSRPAILADDISGLCLEQVTAALDSSGGYTLVLKKVNGFSQQECPGLKMLLLK
jgi:hypothetical protein